jgi:hypothetical protein
MTKQQLTPKGEARLINVNYAISGLSLLGGIAGVVYSNKKGGGFWKGVGFFFLGGIVFSTVGAIATMPLRNKIIKEDVIDVTELY